MAIIKNNKSLSHNQVNKIWSIYNEIENYCLENEEFPRNYINPKTEVEKLSSRLYSWLYRSGYNTRCFIYKNLKDSNGKSLLSKLKKLESKYKISNKKREYALKVFEKIKEYVKKYEDIPRHLYAASHEQITSSHTLYIWLTRNGYFSGEFRYKNIKTDSGLTLKEELDSLYLMYDSTKKDSVGYVLKKFREIKKYCEKYQEWPKQYKNPTTEKEKEAKKLNNWLCNSCYYSEEFKYKSIKTENNLTLQQELDKLYLKYSANKKGTISFVLKKVEEIKLYCNKYQEWPRYIDNPTTEKDRESNRLYAWICYSGYLKKEFKYDNILSQNGVKIRYELDSLYNKLYDKRIDNLLTMAESLKKYCEEYQEWPKQHSNLKTEKEKKSQKLYRWLFNSGYISGNFKFTHVKFNGTSVKTILDYYYFMYGVNNIWSAKDSHDVAASSYYYVINIWKELENNNEEMVKYYYEALKNLLGNKFSQFNVEEIMNILSHDIDSISEYFLHKYLEYSIANDTWIYFYKSLYEYSLYKKQNKIESSR